MTSALRDTSTLILLARIGDASVLPNEPLISTITLAELSVGPLVAVDEGERAVRLAHLQHAEATSIRCRSTLPLPEPLGASRHRSVGQAGRQPHGRTTR